MTNATTTKTAMLATKTAAGARGIVEILRSRGIPAKLAGGHGGDGMRSDAANVRGVALPADVLAAIRSVRAAPGATMAEVIDMALETLRA